MSDQAVNEAKPSNWNAPNIITGARIVATPFFVWLLIAGHDNVAARWGAAAFFVIAIATDALDGYLARSRGLITDLGKLLDPIADKGLTGAAFVVLAVIGELPWWIVVLVLVREIGITIHRLMVSGNIVLAAAWMGKLKTVAQAVALTLAIAPLGTVLPFAEVVYWVNVVTMTIAVILTVVSGIDYVVGYMRMRKTSAADK